MRRGEIEERERERGGWVDYSKSVIGNKKACL